MVAIALEPGLGGLAVSCNCVQGRYFTYPGSGNLNEQCQIFSHPSSAHEDAFQTAGKSPSLKIWIEDLTTLGDITHPKQNQAAVAPVSTGRVLLRSLIYAC